MTSPTRFFFKKHCHLKFTSASLPRVTLTPSFLPHLKLESCLVSTWRGQTTPLCIAGAKNKPNGKREAPFGSCGTARQRMCTLIPTAAIIKASTRKLALHKTNKWSASAEEVYWLTVTLSPQAQKISQYWKGFQYWATEILYLTQYLSVVAESKQGKELRGTTLLMKNIPQPRPEVNTTFEIIQ